MLTTAIAGLITGLSLIVAIGAQNAMLLRHGLAREHVGVSVAICALSDLVLIAAGVAGIGTVVAHAAWAITVVRWIGVVFLTGYGLVSLRRARRASALTADGPGAMSLRATALQMTALTWLNPHVYLDTLLLLGSVANSRGPGGRWWFALGAGAASVLWFTALGYGARLAAPLLSRPRSWQALDVLIGLTMLGIAVMLALG